MSKKKRSKRVPFNSKKYWEQKQRIWERDKGKCQSPHCQNQVDYHLEGEKWAMDHIIPVSKGGSNDDSNLRVLCEFCHLCRDDSYLPPHINTHSRLARKYVLTGRLEKSVLEKFRWKG